MEEDRIGIPPHLLGRDKGLRIPIQHWGEGLLVFDKPQGIASKADPWYPNDPDLEGAFNAQIPEGKPELVHHSIDQIGAFNPLESEATGIVLACCSVAARDLWKNAYGSRQFIFHSLIVTRKSTLTEAFYCDLPLVRHFVNQQMIVSHNLGKKTFTRFTPLAEGRGADAWLASTRYLRMHQLRVHSRERGIPPLRDPIYDPDYPLELREPDRAKLDWIHSYAVQNDCVSATNCPIIKVPTPRYWKRNLRKTGLEIDEIMLRADEIIENITLPIE